MKVSEAINSNFVEHGDLGGKDVALTIARYERPGCVSRADKSKIDKPILYFEKTKKGFVLNKTNMRLIRLMYGDEMDAWIGRRITLRPTTCRMAKGAADKVGCTVLRQEGKMAIVPCIRVKLEIEDGGFEEPDVAATEIPLDQLPEQSW